jgi:lipid-binding SYLF domain-containing protein
MRIKRNCARSVAWTVCFLLLGSLVVPRESSAATAQAIDASVDTILQLFKEKHKGGAEALKKAKGVLVFPEIIQAGLVVGGQYGEGALRIGGKTVGYYSIGAGSFGLTAGAESKALIILFLQEGPLKEFIRDARTDKSWQVGLNGSIVLVNVGGAGTIDSAMLNRPIVAFALNQQGLFLNLSLQGSKITKLNR